MPPEWITLFVMNLHVLLLNFFSATDNKFRISNFFDITIDCLLFEILFYMYGLKENHYYRPMMLMTVTLHKIKQKWKTID